MPAPRGKSTRGGLRRLLDALRRWLGAGRSATRLAPRGPTLRFGEFELELETGHLTRLGETVKIQPQPARVLQYLAERAGSLVTREELHVHLWGEDHHVNFDQGLNFCILQVRQALDDSARSPTFVETIPRRGYRFLVPVDRVGEDVDRGPGQGWRGVKASGWLVLLGVALTVAVGIQGRPAPPTRVAVLPFAAGADRVDERRFAELVGEELSGYLVRAVPEGVGVVAALDLGPEAFHRGSSELGRALESELLLEGDVVRDGDRLRVLVRLVRARDGVHLWAGIYEISMDAADWPRRFDQVAVEIAGELEAPQRAGLPPGA